MAGIYDEEGFLLGSTDVSSLVVSFESPENRAADIGHQAEFGISEGASPSPN